MTAAGFVEEGEHLRLPAEAPVGVVQSVLEALDRLALPQAASAAGVTVPDQGPTRALNNEERLADIIGCSTAQTCRLLKVLLAHGL